MHYNEILLNDKNIEIEILEKVFIKKSINPENFYLTGYEYIPLAKNRTFALETILTSVISPGKQIIIFDSGEENILPVELCLKNDINFKTINTTDYKPDIEQLESLLNNHSGFTHACISLTDTSLYAFGIQKILEVLARYNVNVIINYSGNVKNLVSLDINNFDYLAAGTGHDNVSFVAARRSRLVQTEGNARSIAKDLHGFWQQTLRNRRRKIEPMCI